MALRVCSLVALALLGALMATHAQAQALEVSEVAPGVFVHYGLTAPMTSENAGATANIGFVIGEAAVAEIIGTGISKDELIAAHERAVKDRKAHDPGPPLEPGPFAQVVGILERLHKGGLLGESGSTLA